MWQQLEQVFSTRRHFLHEWLCGQRQVVVLTAKLVPQMAATTRSKPRAAQRPSCEDSSSSSITGSGVPFRLTPFSTLADKPSGSKCSSTTPKLTSSLTGVSHKRRDNICLRRRLWTPLLSTTTGSGEGPTTTVKPLAVDMARAEKQVVAARIRFIWKGRLQLRL